MYAELHCHTAYSFLDGVDEPLRLATEAARLGLSGLAVTDHNGLYAAIGHAQACRTVSVPAIYGSELGIGAPGLRAGDPDPGGRHLLVLARGPGGYRALSQAISEANLAGGRKGRPLYHLERLAELAAGYWMVLTGCRKGHVPAALVHDGPEQAGRQLDRLVSLFGRQNVAVELTDHQLPDDDSRNDALAELAAHRGLPMVATTAAHYARPAGHRLAAAMAAVRARRPLDAMDGWSAATGTAYLRSEQEMLARFAAYPDAVRHAGRIGEECAFDLRVLVPRLPRFPTPEASTELDWLTRLTRGNRRPLPGPGRCRPGVAAGAARTADHQGHRYNASSNCPATRSSNGCASARADSTGSSASCLPARSARSPGAGPRDERHDLEGCYGNGIGSGTGRDDGLAPRGPIGHARGPHDRSREGRRGCR